MEKTETLKVKYKVTQLVSGRAGAGSLLQGGVLSGLLTCLWQEQWVLMFVSRVLQFSGIFPAY